MKKSIRRLVAAALSSVLLFSAVSCSTGSKSGKMGRYVEERYELPDGVSYIQTLTKLDNGSIVMIGSDKEWKLVKYTSEDGGQTWTQGVINQPQVEGKEVSMGQCLVLNDGSIFTAYSLYEPYVESEKDENADNNIAEDDMVIDKGEYVQPETKYIKIDTDGNITDLDISFAEESNEEFGYSGEPYNFLAASNGDIFYQNSNGDTVVQIDGETFEEKYRYQATDWINNFFLVGDSLVIWEYSGVTEYDINTGKDKGSLEKLENETVKGNMQYNPNGINSNSKDKIYYYSVLGLYTYDMKTKENKMIVDGSLSSFGSTESSLVSFVEKEDNQFLAVFNDWGSDSCELINYSYNPDIPAVPDDQLRVYSLIESDTIRQAISAFSKANPEVYVKYEVALNWGDGVTEADALKTLNTEIMGGNGPDVILLDNLSADSYIQKGLLEDISDVISEYTNSDDLFKGMVDAYTVDGKIYQFPTTFSVPIVIGEKDVINKITDLDSFAAVIKELGSKSDNRIIDNAYSPKSFLYSLYYLYENGWLNEDKTINEENLTKFLTTTKEMYDICNEKQENYWKKMEEVWSQNESDKDFIIDENATVDEEFDDGDFDKGEVEEDPASNIYELNYSLMPSAYADAFIWDELPPQLVYGGLNSTWTVSSLVSILYNNPNLDYKVLSRGDENIFAPMESIGVNAKSSQKDIAKKFVKQLLENKSQAYKGGQGLSANKKKLLSDLQSYKEAGYEVEFDEETNHYIQGYYSTMVGGVEKQIKELYPNDDDINRLIGEIEKLNIAPKINRTLLLEVGNQFDKYVNGESTVEDAVSTIVDNLDLYLAE